MRRLSLLVLSLLLLVSRGAIAQSPQDRAWGTATAAFRDLVRTDSIVGGTLALVRDGRVLRRLDLGFQDRAQRIPMGPRAIMHWGSVTKTLTAVAVLGLRDRGMFSLDDPITTWVPELRQVHNPWGSMDGITLRMLLSHSSGLQNPTWPWRRYEAWEPFEPTRWQQLVSMMPYMQLRFPPGSRYGYSNPAYIYLARVLEAEAGDAWQSYVYKNLFLPLGMTASSFGATPWHLRADRSSNYTLVRDSSGAERVEDNGREFDPGITIPNGGWNAPVTDLARWVAFLAGPAPGDTAQAALDDVILARRTFAEAWRPVVAVGNDEGESMGLGFFLLPTARDTLVGHTGEQAGFRSFVYFNRRTRTGVIGVVNTTNDARPDESGRAFRRALVAAAGLLD